MVFENYLLPVMPNHTKSILDYDVQIRNLRPEATFFVPAETGNVCYLSLLNNAPNFLVGCVILKRCIVYTRLPISRAF